MKSVCAKHDQAFEDANSCPWCEPAKAEGPPAAPAAPPAAQVGGNGAAQMNATAAAATPVSYGPCACKKFFLGPPGNYFDGAQTHTIFYCTAVPP